MSEDDFLQIGVDEEDAISDADNFTDKVLNPTEVQISNEQLRPKKSITCIGRPSLIIDHPDAVDPASKKPSTSPTFPKKSK